MKYLTKWVQKVKVFLFSKSKIKDIDKLNKAINDGFIYEIKDWKNFNKDVLTLINRSFKLSDLNKKVATGFLNIIVEYDRDKLERYREHILNNPIMVNKISGGKITIRPIKYIDNNLLSVLVTVKDDEGNSQYTNISYKIDDSVIDELFKDIKDSGKLPYNNFVGSYRNIDRKEIIKSIDITFTEIKELEEELKEELKKCTSTNEVLKTKLKYLTILNIKD